jgi:hypothetical protein
VRNRSGYAVMKITGTWKEFRMSLTASSPELPSAVVYQRAPVLGAVFLQFQVLDCAFEQHR